MPLVYVLYQHPFLSALPTDLWVKATWQEYLLQVKQLGYEKAKGSHLDGWMAN
jgi:hypothetical protein